MTVKFRDPISAQACVLACPFHLSQRCGTLIFDLDELQKMQGRYFSGRRVEASLWIGKQHFKRSNAADEVEDTGGAEGEKQRLDAFAHWLLTEGD
jgi:HIV Tat-specific factor 1